MKHILTYLVTALLVASCVPPNILEVPPNLTTPITTPESSISSNQVALVIGNSQYEYRPLPNPKHDAEAMAKVLRHKGFEVILKKDLTHDGMEQAIAEFETRLATRKEVGLFYYAGHGVQINQTNYLVPINNEHIKNENDVQKGAIRLDDILQGMETANDGLNIVVLDACRDNPFKDQTFTRSLSRGLARTPVQESNLSASASVSGILIALATSPGKTASDGLYTQHLVEAMQTPGLTVEDVFKRVYKAVNKASNAQQSPWYNASLSGSYCFGGC